MPPRTASATLPLERARGAHVLRIGRERAEGDGRDMSVGFGLGLEPLRPVTDGGMRHAHAAVEPRPATEPANDGNADGAHYGRARLRTRMAEIEERRARFL